MHLTQLLPLALPLLQLPQATAWGSLAHRTVAYLSTHSYKPETSVFVSTILANEHGWDISDAALWPDKGVKRRRPETAQWHFIDARDDPPHQCGVKFKRDCEHEGTAACIVSALKNTTNTLLSPTSSPIALREALMFTLHFLGDIHQPLHTEYLSRGGNDIPVCFDSSCGRTNLHSVWDSFIPAKLRNVSAHGMTDEEDRAHAKAWAGEIWNRTKEGEFGGGMFGLSGALSMGVDGEQEVVRQKSDGNEQEECMDVKTPIQCALKWANESNAWICKYVLKKGAEWLRMRDLGDEYFEGAKPIVEDMVAKGGMRLGGWLNEIVEERMKRIGELKAEEASKVYETGDVEDLDTSSGLEL